MGDLRSAARYVSAHLNLLAGGRWIILSASLGILIGLAAAAFQWCLDMAHAMLFERPQAVVASGVGTGPGGQAANILFLLLVPALGAAGSGWLTSRFAPEATGHGTDALVRAYHRNRGKVRFRVAPLKLLASMLTLGTGGSAGREGPVAQFGGTLGSTIATMFGMDVRTRRILLLAGAAAGIGAIFRAPLGGALFAAEVVYRGPDFEGPAVFPGVIASIVSYSVFVAIQGPGSLFHLPELDYSSSREIPFYLVLGLLCATIGIIYVRVFYAGEHMFRRIPLPAPARAALGGLTLGALTVAFGFFTGDLGVLLGGGYGLAQNAMDSTYGPGTLISLAGAKILATTATIGAGGSGGVFAPSLAIGACLGGAFGQLARLVFLHSAPNPAACALVGMGGFFAGVAKTPLTAVVLISEMTGSYGLLLPLMLVSTVACLLSPRSSIYREQVTSRIDSPAHLGELLASALAHMRVSDALAKPERRAEFDRPRAEELIEQGVLTMTTDRDLREALELLAGRHQDLLVVVSSDDASPVAILSQQDLLAAYQSYIRKAMEPAEE